VLPEQKFAVGKLAASSSALREEKKTSAEALAFFQTCRNRLRLKINYFNAALSKSLPWQTCRKFERFARRKENERRSARFLSDLPESASS